MSGQSSQGVSCCEPEVLGVTLEDHYSRGARELGQRDLDSGMWPVTLDDLRVIVWQGS